MTLYAVTNSYPRHATMFGLNDLVVSGTAVQPYVSSAVYGGGGSQATPASSDVRSNTVFLAAGDYSLRMYYQKNTDGGILDVYIDGVVVSDSLDTYAAAGANTSLSLSVTLAYSGVHVVKFVVTGKNAASSSYNMRIAVCEFTQTSDLVVGAGGLLNVDSSTIATRALRWHDEATVTAGNALTVTIGTQAFNDYATQSPSAINDTFTQSIWLRSGTYSMKTYGVKGPSMGQVTWYINGTSIATNQDWYNATTAAGFIVTVASISIAYSGNHILKGVVAAKNASSSSYDLSLTSYAFMAASD